MIRQRPPPRPANAQVATQYETPFETGRKRTSLRIGGGSGGPDTAGTTMLDNGCGPGGPGMADTTEPDRVSHEPPPPDEPSAHYTPNEHSDQHKCRNTAGVLVPTSPCGSSPRSSGSPGPPSAGSSSGCGSCWRGSWPHDRLPTWTSCGSWTEPSSPCATARLAPRCETAVLG